MKNSNPHDLARKGYGWEDLVVMCGLTEAHARLLVLGRFAYMAWKIRQEKLALKETG